VSGAGDLELAHEQLPSGGQVLGVRGELDLATVSEMEQVLADTEQSQVLVVDLSECEFLDSSAVHVLLAAARRAADAGGELALVVPEGGVRRVLEIAGVEASVRFHSRLAQALGRQEADASEPSP
jgi:anti-sigma B factor antagonist